MTLKSFVPRYGGIIELGADPASDSNYTITAKSMWLDTSVSPAVLRERSSDNTTWNRVFPLMGEFSVTVSGGNLSDWTGTVSHSEIKSAMRVVMTPDAGTLSQGMFMANLKGPVRTGAFDWQLVSFKNRTVSEVIKVTWIAFYPQV